jgi:PAS domain S-box-containing protein
VVTRKILVVDNDPAILAFCSMFLGKHGYEVRTAEDGLSALKVLEDYVPDVMFIDLIMPNIPGDKLCAIVRGIERLKGTFRVLLSGISAEEQAHYLQYGFNACIAKGPLKNTGEYLLTLLHRLEDDAQREAAPMELGLEGLAKREITKELLSSKKHYELVLGNMAEGILEMTPDARIVYVNPSVTDLLGIAETSLLGESFLRFFKGRSLQRIERCLAAAATSPQIIGQDDPITIGVRRLTVNVLPVYDEGARSLTVILNDVTDRYGALLQLRQAHKDLETRVQQRTSELSEANSRLAAEVGERKRAEEMTTASLREKELLLREVHHRVKNNLQIVSSLLKLPLRMSRAEGLADIVRETQDRIRSIWLIHEKLYRSEDLSFVDFDEYVHTLATHLFESYSVDRSRISLTIDCERVRLDVDTAIPCGLVLNEIVSNSLSHAFPGARHGEVAIRLRRVADEHCRLVVRDNGVGIAGGVDFSSESTLGMRIVESLAKQIDGTVEMDTSAGTTFAITFPIDSRAYTRRQTVAES